MSAPRSMMTYSNRFTKEGTQTLVLKAGPTGQTMRIDVGENLSLIHILMCIRDRL